MFHLELKHLEIGYKTPLLSPINLKLNEGNIVALIGINGIGKSTLIKNIAGILKPLSGEINIGGTNIKKLSPKKLAKIIAYSAASDFPSSNFTIRDYVALGRLPYTSFTGLLTAKDKKIVSEAIETSNLVDKAYKDISKISDGQRQRASIARLIAQQSKIMLFDEPTAFLDIEAKYFTLKLFKEIKNKLNNIIIFSTHDINLAIQFADKIWLFIDNTIVQGLPEDLILQGYFSKLFSDKNIFFNNFTGDFDVINTANKKISIIENQHKSKTYWTKNALKKIGYQIDDKANNQIQVLENKWIIKNNQTKNEFSNIENLLNFLNKKNIKKTSKIK